MRTTTILKVDMHSEIEYIDIQIMEAEYQMSSQEYRVEKMPYNRD